MNMPLLPANKPQGFIHLIRHGATADNKNCYVGWGDPVLNEAGQRQALRVAETMAPVPLDAVYSSPLIRAQATAKPVADSHGLSVQLEPALKEIHYGDYQGVSKAGLRLRLRERYTMERLPGGESLLDVFQRVAVWLQKLRTDLSAGLNLAIVGHFWSNRLLLSSLLGLSFEDALTHRGYRPYNGSILVLGYWMEPGGLIRVGESRLILPGIEDEKQR